MGNHDVYIGSAPIRIEVSGAQGPAGRVTVSETAPSDTTARWLDPTDGIISDYFGGAWVTQVTSEGINSSAYLDPSNSPYLDPSGENYLQP